MSVQGYYRYPAIFKDTLVFTSEDDLWTVSTDGGIPRRLTSNLGTISSPFFSPDGATLAFTGREEGHNEVYTMPADGGPIKRITYQGCNSVVIGWTPDGKRILFSGDSGQPFDRLGTVYGVSPEGGLPEHWPVGPAVSISITAGNRTVIGRNNNDPARWKRYKGGTAGDIWVDAEGNGQFRRLLKVDGNAGRPMWIGDRIYFLSDHEGIANIYSCYPTGEDVRRHTQRTDYFARYPATDGERIVYHAGADLYVYDPRTERDTRVNVEYHSPRVYRQRRFVDSARYMDSYAIHPQGYSLAITSRGKSFTFGNWEGAVTQQGGDDTSPHRYRLTRWLNDGKRVVTLTDRGGEEALEIHATQELKEPIRLQGLDIGRPNDIQVSPTQDQLVLTNHRNEILFVDVNEKTLTVIDRSDFRGIAGFGWSPDGRWVAYGFPITQYTTALKLWDRTTGQTHVITRPVLHDTSPAFDREGKYLYFIGQRDLNPIYDNLHFDLGFPKGMRPFLLTLKADTPNPFAPAPRPLHEERKPEPTNGEANGEEEANGETPKPLETPTGPVEIDLDGIQQR
ncbi:MAG TPA: peptidase, partial [Chthonomonadaceae bacterium]|nr:peptidase [Chthonomonadaceae bacterium]